MKSVNVVAIHVLMALRVVYNNPLLTINVLKYNLFLFSDLYRKENTIIDKLPII